MASTQPAWRPQTSAAKPTRRLIRVALALAAITITITLSGCGGGSSSQEDGPSGSTSTVGVGVPTAGSAVVGVVPVQSTAQLALLAGSDAALGYNDGAAANAQFAGIFGIAVDSVGNRYVLDGHNDVIRKIDVTGNVSTYAGTPGVIGDLDGAALTAQFKDMAGLAIDSSGNLFVTETSNVVREVTNNGQVVTLAGVSGQSGSSDGTGTAALFNSPGALTTDGNGNIYVSDSGGLTIRKINSMGAVTTIFGTPGMSGNGSSNPALAINIESLAFDGSGDLFFFDGNALREITQGGVVSTINGSIQPSASNDSTCGLPALAWNGSAFVASANCTLFNLSVTGATSLVYTFPPYGPASGFETPGSAIAVEATGNIDVPINSIAGGVIEQFSPSGAMSIVAGTLPHYGDVDGTGSAASFGSFTTNGNSLYDAAIAADASGNLYVADSGNNTIRKITAAGVVTTLAGQTQIDAEGSLVGGYVDGQGSAARFNNPSGIAVNGAGMIYVADTGNQVIRQITPQGLVTTFAGGPPSSAGQRTDGTAANARFSVPAALTIDKAGNLYVGDNAYNEILLTGETVLNGTTVRRITPQGVVNTIAGDATTAGFVDGTYSSAQFSSISSIALDPAGNIFVLDNGNIREITGGTVKTSRSASTTLAAAITIDGAGNLYYLAQHPNIIYRVDASGNRTTYAGSTLDGFRPGPLPGALNYSTAMTVDGNGLAVMMAGGIATIQ